MNTVWISCTLSEKFNLQCIWNLNCTLLELYTYVHVSSPCIPRQWFQIYRRFLFFLYKNIRSLISTSISILNELKKIYIKNIWRSQFFFLLFFFFTFKIIILHFPFLDPYLLWVYIRVTIIILQYIDQLSQLNNTECVSLFQ